MPPRFLLPRVFVFLALAGPVCTAQVVPNPAGRRVDEPNPIEAARWSERMRLVEKQRREAAPGKKAAEILGLAGTDRALVILVEFGGTDAFNFIPTGPDKSTWDPIGKADKSESAGTVGDCSLIVQKYNITGPTRFTYTGPLHNQISRPKSAADVAASIIWTEDFSREYYQALIAGNGVRYRYARQDGSQVDQDLTGATVHSYFQDMSGGAYGLTADVVGWVQVPHSIWWYGADPCPGRFSFSSWASVRYDGGIPGAGTKRTLVQESLDAVKTAYPSFNWAQYDANHDGVIDRLWIIIAGLSEDWLNVQAMASRTDLSEGGLVPHSGSLSPAYPVASGIAAGPYIMMSEETGLATLVHEAGHNLGAIDLYAYTGGNPSPGFWSVMADDQVGLPWYTIPSGFDPLHLDQWGWLNPVVISDATKEYMVTLRQVSGAPPGQQGERGVKIRLPDGRRSFAAQPRGDYYWWGGEQNSTNSRMTLLSPIILPVMAASTLSFTTAYNTEQGWDFVWVQVSTDGGNTWNTLTNAHTICQHESDWVGGAQGFPADLCAAQIGGFTGKSSGFPSLVTESFDLSAYRGKQTLIRFWYMTDPSTLLDGVFIDNITVTAGGSQVFSDGAEGGDANWGYIGAWQRNNGGLNYAQAYYLQWRNVSSTGGFDRGLGNPGWSYGPANTGLLVWYSNERYKDNESGGYLFDPPSFGPKGRLLLVDAHPEPYRYQSWVNAGYSNEAANHRSRSLMRDAPFSTMDSVPFSYAGVTYPGRPAVSRFSDGLSYYPGLELVSPGPNEASPKRWITQQWDASVVVPSTKSYAAKAPGYAGNEEVLYGCSANQSLGTLACTSRGKNLSLGVAGGDGNPMSAGGQYGWNVQIISQTDSQATLLIWNGVYTVNAASFQAAAPVAPGSLAAINGDSLAPSTVAASILPLPLSLAGVSVTMNGIPAPLLFVSPGQINVQVPYEVPPGSATVVVTNNTQPPLPGRLQVAAAAPGIFLYGDHALVWNNETQRWNTSAAPAPAGGLIVAFGTGQGAVTPAIGTGRGSPLSPLSIPVGRVTATIGGQEARVEWAGMTPQCAGVMQAHIRVPDLPAGDYPLVISVDGRPSNAPLVTVSRP